MPYPSDRLGHAGEGRSLADSADESLCAGIFSVVPGRTEFEWFTHWVHQRLSLTLTVTTGPSLDGILDAFRADQSSRRQLTWLQAVEFESDDAPSPVVPLSARSIELLKRQGRTPAEIQEVAEARQAQRPPVLRVGRFGDWTAVIEQSTTRGADQDVLEATSAAGATSLAYCFTQTIAVLLFARDGALVSGFDTTVPTIRWGPNQGYFDDLLARVVGDARPVAPAEVAQILKDGFDVSIERAVLEGPLPAATLRP